MSKDNKFKDPKEIKLEIRDLLKDGKSSKEAFRIVYKKYGNGNYQAFDNIYGRYARREFKKLGRIAINAQKNTTGTKTNIEVKDGITEIETQSKVVEGELFTPESVMITNGYDPELFEFSNSRASIWDAQTPDGIQKMQSLRVTVKPKSNVLTDKDISDMIAERESLICNTLPEYPQQKKFIVTPNGKIALWHMGDLHFGRECKKESEGIEWNTDIATEDLIEMKNELLTILSLQPVSKLLLAITGDSINADTIDGCTTHGTPQDMAMRYNKLYETYYNVMADIIEDISKTLRIPIELLHVVGNHDTKTMFDMMITMKAHFRNNPNVKVSIEFNHRKYREYGNSLMVFTHGDCEKGRILDIPADEAPKAYGRCKYCYVFTEHLHNLKTTTSGRTVGYQTNSPAPPDKWTKKSGYVGSRRGSELFVIDKQYGITSQNFLRVKYDEVDEFVVEVEDEGEFIDTKAA